MELRKLCGESEREVREQPEERRLPLFYLAAQRWSGNSVVDGCVMCVCGRFTTLIKEVLMPLNQEQQQHIDGPGHTIQIDKTNL